MDAGCDVATFLEEGSLKGVLLTHWHADHWVGLTRLSWTPKPLPFLCPEPEKTPPFFKRGLVPLKKRPFLAEEWGKFKIYPIPLRHTVPTWGYLVEDTAGHRVALLWDTKGLPSETFSFLLRFKVDLAVVDSTYPPSVNAPNHNNLTEAVETGLAVAREVFLTHLSHQTWPPLLLEEYLHLKFPQKAVALAFDGLKHDLSYPLELSLRGEEIPRASAAV